MVENNRLLYMKDRIKKIIESQNMTQQEFAECIKVAPATLSSIFTGRTAPSLKIVEAIKSRFPDISTDWLMFGRGAMTDYKSAEAGQSFGCSSAGTGDSDEPGLGNDATGQPVTTAGQARTVAGMAMASDATRNSVPSCQDAKRAEPECEATPAVKKSDKYERRIVEIRIFYNDQTWETFVPKQ